MILLIIDHLEFGSILDQINENKMFIKIVKSPESS